MKSLIRQLIVVVLFCVSCFDASALGDKDQLKAWAAAGASFGWYNLDLDIYHYSSQTPALSFGVEYRRVSLECTMNYGEVHKTLHEPWPGKCKMSVAPMLGYDVLKTKHWTLTPQVGVNWHLIRTYREDPSFCGGLRVQYSFNRHFGIANVVESDFKQAISDRVQFVVTF